MTIPVAIIDDEELDRYITKRVVQATGRDCRVIEFDAGEEFAEVIADDAAFEKRIGDLPSPLLVLLDINMPRMNGFEVLERLKAAFDAHKREPSSFIVLMYSSSSHDEDQATALDYDFVQGYVVKPLDTETLSEILDKHYGESDQEDGAR
jgi:CheY-like chemotaxis protein